IIAEVWMAAGQQWQSLPGSTLGGTTMNKRTGKFLTSLSALALLQTGAANAAADDVDMTFEEIVVTAQKREQRLMEVPMAITAFGGTELEQRGIDSIQDLSFAVPGLTMREDGPGSYQIFLR